MPLQLENDPPNTVRNSFIRTLIKITIVLLGAIIIGTLAIQWFFYELMWAGPSRGDAVKRACRLARLAPVPGQVVGAENRHNLFAGSTYVVFRASRPEIEKWIADSPGMQGIAPDVFHADFRYETVEMKERSPDPDFDPKVERDFCYKDQWQILPATKNGVRYKIPQDKDANYGTVIIDWDTNTVWIRASHS